MTKKVIGHVMTKHSLTTDEVLNLLGAEELDETTIDEVLHLLAEAEETQEKEEAQEEKED